MLHIREKIIRAFKSGIFPFTGGFKVEKESDEESDKEFYWGNSSCRQNLRVF